MVGKGWEEDIKCVGEEWKKEIERPEDVDMIDPVNDVWNAFVGHGRIIH